MDITGVPSSVERERLVQRRRKRELEDIEVHLLTPNKVDAFARDFSGEKQEELNK